MSSKEEKKEDDTIGEFDFESLYISVTVDDIIWSIERLSDGKTSFI